MKTQTIGPLAFQLVEQGLWDDDAQVRLDVLGRFVKQYAPADLFDDFVATAAAVADDVIKASPSIEAAANLFVKRVIGDADAPAVARKGVQGRVSPLNFAEARKAPPTPRIGPRGLAA